MTYSELVNTVCAKLGLTAEEAKYDGILNKIPLLANECLSDIANRAKPFYKTLIIDIIPSSSVIAAGNLMPNEIISNTHFITFPSDFLSLTNEFIQRVPIDASTDTIHETDIYKRIDGNQFRRMSSRQLLFPNEFNYRYLVPTVCRYPKITGTEGEAEIDIEESVMNIIPNYVVSELLHNDDLTSSLQWRNFYEVSIVALNDSVLAPAGDLHNSDY